MTPWLRLATATGGGAVLAVVAGCVASSLASEPFVDLTERRVEYQGPGREDVAPGGPEEVLIGYFGPDDPDHPEGGDLWLAARMAVEEANRAGGLHGAPFRLVPAWSDDPWGTGVADVARLVYTDEVRAILGSIDGASTHLAEQVVAKARLAMLSPASTDMTVHFANVAWAFSCLPGDDAMAPPLARDLVERTGGSRVVMISTTDHDSRRARLEFGDALRSLGVSPRYHFEVEGKAGELASLALRVAGVLRPGESADAGAVLILAPPRPSARLVVLLREAGVTAQVYGGASMARRVFLERAGEDAEGVIFPLPCDLSAPPVRFEGEFRDRFARAADCTTVQAYDAARLLIAAIRRAGTNRVRIRDALQALSPWPGAAGTVDWDPLGRNRRAPRLARVRNGRILPM